MLGAGTMGNGIAQVCAQAGMHVQLFDVSEDQLEIGLAAIQKMLAKAVARARLNPRKRRQWSLGSMGPRICQVRALVPTS